MTSEKTSEGITPNGSRLFVISPRDERTDVTEAVQILYDALLGSLDWGSGFLSTEEALAVAALAEACGFDLTEAREYLKGMAKEPVYGSIPVSEMAAARAWLESHPEEPK